MLSSRPRRRQIPAAAHIPSPDGSMVNIGAKEGGCQALLEILEPKTHQCQMGKCP